LRQLLPSIRNAQWSISQTAGNAGASTVAHGASRGINDTKTFTAPEAGLFNQFPLRITIMGSDLELVQNSIEFIGYINKNINVL
jgi:hypothetical protein